MALPLTRNRTYGNDTTLHPGDLNDLQDAVIGGKRGASTQIIGAHAFVGVAAALLYYSAGQAQGQVGNGGFNAYCDIQLPAGAVITAVRVRVTPLATDTLRARLVEQGDGSGTVVGTTNTSNAIGDPETIAAAGLAVTVTAGKSYAINVDRNGGALELDAVHWAQVDWYMP